MILNPKGISYSQRRGPALHQPDTQRYDHSSRHGAEFDDPCNTPKTLLGTRLPMKRPFDTSGPGIADVDDDVALEAFLLFFGMVSERVSNARETQQRRCNDESVRSLCGGE